MATKKQRADAAKKKDKRTKIILIVGCVLLVAIGAYEIPSMLAVMNKKAPNTTYDPGPRTTPGGLPNVASAASGSDAASGALASSDVAPASDAGQLVSFSVFETKNPFTPQVSSADTSSTYSATKATTPSKSGADVPGAAAVTATAVGQTTIPAVPAVTVAGAGVGVVPPTATPPSAPAGGTTTTTVPATPAQPAVAIKVNGVVSHVASQGTFPTAAPVFRLVSWTKEGARIAIVGGTYATGDATLAVQLGKPVTLVNQTDGKRYTLELLSTG